MLCPVWGPLQAKELMAAILKASLTAGVAHDRDPIDPRSNPGLHGGDWVPWEETC